MDVLIIDDWGLGILTASERRDLLEILEDCHGRAPTIVSSQLPVEHWHKAIGDHRPLAKTCLLRPARPDRVTR
jgi:DNA replication protein DnaC